MRIFAGPRVEELVVHDLRTPLNVISLALKMLERQPAAQDAELAEDLSFIRSGTADLERMIVCLVEASRMPAVGASLPIERFDVRRLIDEVLEDLRRVHGRVAVEVVASDDAPAEVHLDRHRAKMALTQAISNALVASARRQVTVRLSGAGDRCGLRFESGVAPRDGVNAGPIDPEEFERVIGTAGERRGLDLAMVAMVSNLFGGSAHLEVTPGRGTAVVLDWPARFAAQG